MSLTLRELVPADYDDAVALWRKCPGVVLRGADERDAIARYLARNPGMSFAATLHGALVGTVLCGSDGRRGYLYHLAVDPAHRRRGIGRLLAAKAVDALARAGIDKCHLMVLSGNADARAFWSAIGWNTRSDVQLMSYARSGVSNA